MNYTSEALSSMSRDLRNLRLRYGELMEIYVYRSYSTDRGREMGTHAFMRRAKIMMNSVEQVFELLPPENACDQVPDSDAVARAEIAVHAFLINTFGSIDNLAWVWVCEKSILDRSGKPLDRTEIGLWKHNRTVRSSLPIAIQAYLAKRDDWLAYVADWRHPLAHRVPPYIPPYCVDPANEHAYVEFEQKKIAALRAGNLDELELLESKQKKLMFFKPWLKGSFSEAKGTIWLHNQMLVDFKTIHEIAVAISQALDGQP